MNAPQLRPLGVGEIFDVAINVYRRHAATLLRVVLFVVVPANVLAVLIQASAQPETVTIDGQRFQTSDEDTWTYLAGAGSAALVTFLATTIASGACFKAIADAYLGEAPTWRNSLGFAARRFHSILWVTILFYVVASLGLVLLIVPGVYLWASFGVAVPVLLTEGIKGRRALGRSRRLVKGRWWPVFAVLLLGTILTGIVSSVLTALVGAISFVEADAYSLASIAAQILAGTVSNAITVPFTAAFVIVLYFDLRVRKEAFDLQLLARQIGVEPPGGMTPAPSVPLGPREPVGGSQPPYWPPPPGRKPTSPAAEDPRTE